MEGGRLRLLREVSLAGGYWIIAVGSYTQELEHMVTSSDVGLGLVLQDHLDWFLLWTLDFGLGF